MCCFFSVRECIESSAPAYSLLVYHVYHVLPPHYDEPIIQSRYKKARTSQGFYEKMERNVSCDWLRLLDLREQLEPCPSQSWWTWWWSGGSSFDFSRRRAVQSQTDWLKRVCFCPECCRDLVMCTAFSSSSPSSLGLGFSILLLKCPPTTARTCKGFLRLEKWKDMDSGLEPRPTCSVTSVYLGFLTLDELWWFSILKIIPWRKEPQTWWDSGWHNYANKASRGCHGGVTACRHSDHLSFVLFLHRISLLNPICPDSARVSPSRFSEFFRLQDSNLPSCDWPRL